MYYHVRLDKIVTIPFRTSHAEGIIRPFVQW